MLAANFYSISSSSFNIHDKIKPNAITIIAQNTAKFKQFINKNLGILLSTTSWYAIVANIQLSKIEILFANWSLGYENTKDDIITKKYIGTIIFNIILADYLVRAKSACN